MGSSQESPSDRRSARASRRVGRRTMTAAPVARRGSRFAATAALALCSAAFVACGEDEVAAPEQPESTVTLPMQQTADLREAAEAAGCEIVNSPEAGRAHDAEKEFQASDYTTNPPTSGDHHPEWYQDGIYEPGETDNLGMLVHTLEHGRINVQYAPDTSDATVDQLEALLAESEGYHMLLHENSTGMDYQVAATAWTHMVGCPEMNDRVFDVIRSFRTRYVDQGPEQIP